MSTFAFIIFIVGLIALGLMFPPLFIVYAVVWAWEVLNDRSY